MESSHHVDRFNGLQSAVAALYQWNAAAEAVIDTFEAWIGAQDDKTRYPRHSHASAKADASVQNFAALQSAQWGNRIVDGRALDNLLARIAKLRAGFADDRIRPWVPDLEDRETMAGNIRTAMTIQAAWNMHLTADRQSELDHDFQSYVRALER